MKKLYTITLLTIVLLVAGTANAQDPSFAQFFSSPLNINPALTGNINADWRLISNMRDQWIGPASPYSTGTVSYDTKVGQKKYEGITENSNYLGIGAMLMYDKAMGGVQKSSYGSLNVSYNVKLAEDQYTIVHKLSMGFGATYAHRAIDFSKVDFQSQFTGTGFDTKLPTGEAALSNMKAYTSLNTGIVYSATSETSNFDIGAAAYHLNKPKQTFVQDENQFVAVRKVVHANFETVMNEKVVLNTNAIYQNQSGASYFSIGGSLGYKLDETEENSGTMVNAGLWYWSKNAMIPYVGLAYKDLQIGLSYDVTISKLAQAARKPSTFELSIILRGNRKGNGGIPCPWK